MAKGATVNKKNELKDLALVSSAITNIFQFISQAEHKKNTIDIANTLRKVLAERNDVIHELTLFKKKYSYIEGNIEILEKKIKSLEDELITEKNKTHELMTKYEKQSERQKKDTNTEDIK